MLIKDLRILASSDRFMPNKSVTQRRYRMSLRVIGSLAINSESVRPGGRQRCRSGRFPGGRSSTAETHMSEKIRLALDTLEVESLSTESLEDVSGGTNTPPPQPTTFGETATSPTIGKER